MINIVEAMSPPVISKEARMAGTMTSSRKFDYNKLRPITRFDPRKGHAR